jgi:hypothetical protein
LLDLENIHALARATQLTPTPGFLIPRVTRPRDQPLPPPHVARRCYFLQTVGSIMVVSTVTDTGTFYFAYKDRNLGPQLPIGLEKKSLAVIVSGWDATSLLKNMATMDYNVVREPTISYR